jgi:hypothetical protein
VAPGEFRLAWWGMHHHRTRITDVLHAFLANGADELMGCIEVRNQFAVCGLKGHSVPHDGTASPSVGARAGLPHFGRLGPLFARGSSA